MSPLAASGRQRLIAWTVGLVTVFAASTVSAATLQGAVTDGPTGTPIADATVQLVGGSASTVTASDGTFELDLPPGEYDLAIRATIRDRVFRTRLVNQHVPQYKPARAHLYTDAFVPRSGPSSAVPHGLPARRRPGGTPTPDAEFQLPLAHTEDARLTLPDMPETTIRVARRENPDEGCSNNPIVAIEKMPLDTYVRGVLPPEIGVFRNIDGVEAVYRAFALAAKSYGLWFTLYYDQDNRRRVSEPLPPDGLTWFHIDDTACNQRYSDNRLPITNRAADAVAGHILTRESAPQTIDKYEYAASCGGHGTRPAYQQSLIDDETPTTACVGDWCGHTDCAGHEDNPSLPGDDRCLVRGMCQWGAAEWAKSGKDYRWILEHYQPNLLIRPLAAEPTVDVTGFVYTNPDDIEGSGVPQVRVRTDTGASTRTSAAGRFTFEDIPLQTGSVTLTAAKTGYQTNTRTKMLEAGERNWASIRLRPTTRADTGPADTTGTDGDTGGELSTSGSTDQPSFGALVSPARSDVSSGACHTAPASGHRRFTWLVLVALVVVYRRHLN